MSNSLIRQIKQEMADALLADPFFASIPVMPIVTNDVMSQLQAGQYKANALTVFIDWVSVGGTDTDNPGPWFKNGTFTAEVYEIPAMNAGPDVDEVAENVANILHLNELESQNVSVVEGITKLDNDEFGNNLRIIRIGYPFGFKPRILPSIAPVVISPLTQGSQVVTLTCVTPGAAIFYTLDGSYPAPRAPSALVYSAPVTVSAGQLLKARAWLAGYTSSIPDFSQFQY